MEWPHENGTGCDPDSCCLAALPASLVAKLEAAEKMAEALRNVIPTVQADGFDAAPEREALAAWESAGVDK